MTLMKQLHLLSFFILLTITAFAQDIETLLAEGKRLKAQYKEQEALSKFESVLKKEPDNEVALQQASYLLSVTGDRQKSREQQVASYERAQSYAQAGIRLNEKNAEHHFNYALALGRLSLLADSEGRLKNAKLIKQQAERALVLDPKHAGANHIMGRLNREISNMSSVKVLAAKALYGGVPENCSFAQAELYFQKAMQNRPGYILYYYDAALNYVYMGKKDEARKLLEKAVSLPMITPDDPYRVNDCKALLAKLK